MGFRALPTTPSRTTRPTKKAGLKRRPLPKGLFMYRAAVRCLVRRRSLSKIRVKDDELDWTERSREIFETAMDKGKEYSKTAMNAWEAANDKPAIVVIGVIGLVVLYATNATLGAMESVPLVGATLKIVGLYVTGWFIYRMVAYEVDRDEFMSSLKSLTNKITGERNA